MNNPIVLLASLDTKGPEAEFLRGCIEEAKEFARPPHRKIGIKLYHWVTALVLVLVLVLMIIGGVFG